MSLHAKGTGIGLRRLFYSFFLLSSSPSLPFSTSGPFFSFPLDSSLSCSIHPISLSKRIHTTTFILFSANDPTMTTPVPSERVTPRVLIVGAGLSGLMLAILFEKMGDVEYFILERASAPKPLGNIKTTSTATTPALTSDSLKKRRKSHSTNLCTRWIFFRIGHVPHPQHPDLV